MLALCVDLANQIRQRNLASVSDLFKASQKASSTDTLVLRPPKSIERVCL